MAPDGDTFGITGIPPPPDVKDKTDPKNGIPYVIGMPLRYEITEFFESMMLQNDLTKKKQWTLFIMALKRFKEIPVDKKLSYFQVAGIHGSPEQPWDDADPPRKEPPHKDRLPGVNPYGGYCHHNTIAFPTWHRPYMLLFEQCLWRNMNEIIEKWVKDDILSKDNAVPWTSAANTWRLFYWDWARKQKYPINTDDINTLPWNDFGIPYLFSVEFVPIYPPTCPEEEQTSNPLWNFENPERDPKTEKPLAFGNMPENKQQWNIPNGSEEDDGKVVFPWGKCSATSRWGILYDKNTKAYSGLEGKNDWQKCNTALNQAGNRMYVPRALAATPGDQITISKGKISQTTICPQEPNTITYEEWYKTRPGNLADAVNRMFSWDYNGDWGSFASTKWYNELPSKTAFLSLEYIHNNIHNITGGSSLGPDVNRVDPNAQGIYGVGHMCDVPVAAFDPIFWMHHSNIDRYTAMWQCLNWDKWFEKEPPRDPTGPAQVEDVKPDDPLQPFHLRDCGNARDKTNQWTSDLARKWTDLHYQYDDLMPRTPEAVTPDGKLDPEIYISDLREHIHKLYPGTSYQAWAIRQDSSISNAAFFGEQETGKAFIFEDYLINVVYDRYALNGKSYAIEFFLGKQYVGQVYSLGGARPGTEVGCANCGQQRDAEVLSKGQVPISIPLMRHAAGTADTEITTIQGAEVDAYLAKHLNVRYYEAGGRGERPVTDFPKTQMAVYGGKATWNREKRDGRKIWKPPVYSENPYSILQKATAALPGGSVGGFS